MESAGCVTKLVMRPDGMSCRFPSCWAHTIMASVSRVELGRKSSMFQRESTALFHEHLKAYAIMGISATVERPSLARAIASYAASTLQR